MQTLPAVLVINLDRDVDRLAHMRRELDRAGLSFERFAAQDGTNLAPELRNYFPEPHGPRAILSRGEIGCYASHLAICRAMAKAELPAPLCVLEDDIELAPDFKDVLLELMQRLPQGWDFVRLSNESKNVVRPLMQLTSRYQLVRYSKVPGSTGASLISRSGAAKFVAAAPRTLPVDQDLKRVWKWRLDMYGVIPAPVRRDIFDTSSIDSMTDAGWRTKRWRISRFRQNRTAEMLARQMYGLREFGLTRWISAELANMQAVITPKKERAAFLARVSQRLASG